MLFVLLWRHRERLNPLDKDEEQVIAERAEDLVLADEPVTQFALMYRPRCVLTDRTLARSLNRTITAHSHLKKFRPGLVLKFPIRV